MTPEQRFFEMTPEQFAAVFGIRNNPSAALEPRPRTRWRGFVHPIRWFRARRERKRRAKMYATAVAGAEYWRHRIWEQWKADHPDVYPPGS